MDDIGKGIERFLRCADEVINASSRNFAAASDARTTAATNAYHESLDALCTNWQRLECQVRDRAGTEAATVCAKAWIDPHLSGHLFKRIESLLVRSTQQVSIATSSSGPPMPRHHAAMAVMYGGKAALLLLDNASCMARFLTADTSSTKTSKAGRKAGEAAIAAMTDKGFMKVVVDAVRGMVATASLTTRSGTASGAGVRQGAAAGAELYGTLDDNESAKYDMFMTTTALSVVSFASNVGSAVLDRLNAAAFASGGPTNISSIPHSIATVAEALAESQLLAAAAAALLDCPNVLASQRLRREMASGACAMMQQTAKKAAKMVVLMSIVQVKLQLAKGCQARPLAAGLLRAARHEAVQRLQVALLDQLAAHAGMGAELEGEGEGEGQEGEAGAWAGSSGSWWLAREQAQRGQLLGLEEGEAGQGEFGETRSRMAGWLEDYHCHILYSAFVEWNAGAEDDLDAEAGASAAPPPVLRARLAARAAEALCRLCRGQGLGGAYAPAPTWEFAMAPSLLFALMPSEEQLESIPAATAQACLPHWLEAAGWLAVLLSDATAAAMGRLRATPLKSDPDSVIICVTIREGSQPTTLVDMLETIKDLANNSAYGIGTLPAAAQADVRRRLFRCGLAASLDHTLRLLYSAHDNGPQAVASALRGAAPLASALTDVDLVPMLPPTRAAGGGSGGGVADAGSSSGISGGSAAAGSGETRPQLGLLLTLSKRAAMLARELEAGAGAGMVAAPGGAQGPLGVQRGQQVVAWASDALDLLTGVLRCAEAHMQRSLKVVRSAAAAEGGGDSGGGEVMWRPDAGCVDEVHEALALAVAAGSKLAAPLAWQLAMERATAATAAAARGSAVRCMTGCQKRGVIAISELLMTMIQCCNFPLQLPPAQLLACQPHRLLAAACALAAALPADSDQDQKESLGMWIPGLLTGLASYKTLSARVRSWLVPPARPAAAASTSSGCDEDDTCAGCLAEPLQCALRHTISLAPQYAMHTAALMAIAVGEIRPKVGVPCCAGGRDATGEADGGFQQCAAAMAEVVWLSLVDPSAIERHPVLLPDGSVPNALLDGVVDAMGKLPPPPPPSAPSGALPPPLTLPLGRAGALPRLYMCGNPWCGSFARESEGALPLKHCGGCRVVRYCGAVCQRAHWREGHKGECRELAAGAAGVAGQAGEAGM